MFHLGTQKSCFPLHSDAVLQVRVGVRLPGAAGSAGYRLPAAQADHSRDPPGRYCCRYCCRYYCRYCCRYCRYHSCASPQVVYSITDRASLAGASSILGGVTAEEEQGGNQVLLLGNKRDLDHLREVSSNTRTLGSSLSQSSTYIGCDKYLIHHHCLRRCTPARAAAWRSDTT